MNDLIYFYLLYYIRKIIKTGFNNKMQVAERIRKASDGQIMEPDAVYKSCQSDKYIGIHYTYILYTLHKIMYRHYELLVLNTLFLWRNRCRV